ncbi:MAG TPA: SDR family oxidoreductase [Candidatus Saccharimonadales bacterium]|nr:SDR family oxidoreductase [Candidatus Saccharimonadales bacterium]
MTLKNKTVLVTGGSKGIGRACVLAFAEQGANVIINYAHDEKTARTTAEAAMKHDVKILIVQADIANQTEVDSMFATIKAEFPTIDVLVNNAGIFAEGDSPDNLEAIQKVFDTDLFGEIRVTNAARKLMPKGKIIFISSIHGKLGNGRPSAIGYSASKAALDSYMKNLAKALAPDVLVNSIAPGRTLTPMWGNMTEEYKRSQAEGHLIDRWIEPSEIADGVVFLAKNDAVCGEVLVIDGGMSLKVLG